MRLQFVQDIVDKVRGKKRRGAFTKDGRIYPLPHKEKMAIIKDIFVTQGCCVFVETGTFMGDTTNTMRKCAQQVYTIELSHPLFQKAVERFKAYPHVECLEGNSMHVLPKVLKKISAKPLFWLDGHYSAGKTARGEKDTPIMEELASIHHSGIQSMVLLIDDARCLGSAKDYPTIEELQERVQLYWKDATFENKDDIIRICIGN